MPEHTANAVSEKIRKDLRALRCGAEDNAAKVGACCGERKSERIYERCAAEAGRSGGPAACRRGRRYWRAYGERRERENPEGFTSVALRKQARAAEQCYF